MTHPALVITIGQIRAGHVPAEELLRMAKAYARRNKLVRHAHLPQFDKDQGYARFIRDRFPMSTIKQRQALIAECRREYLKLRPPAD